jgi:AraC-like DNA-binding protein/mannose-6-phosphate isomerase-like protein (cupin superfamily)
MSNSSRSKTRGIKSRRKQNADVMKFNEISQLPVSAHFGGHQAQFLYCGVLAKKWWRNYLHMHSFFEVCHVFEGKGTFFINGNEYPVAPGDTLIAKPREPHEIISSRRQPLGIYFWAYMLTATADKPNHGGDALFELMRRFPSSTKPIVRVKGLDQVLKLMTQEVAHAAPGYLEMINNLAAKAIVDTARAALPGVVAPEKAAAQTRSFGESVVQTAIQYLGDNLARRFEVRDVAAQVNLSERQLRRVFLRYTGTSILAHLTNLRIERAMQLLLNTDMPIKQIATAVGYPDTHYFTTLFGRETRTTPAAFRRKKGTEFLRRRRRNSLTYPAPPPAKPS